MNENKDDWRPGFERLQTHSGICPFCGCMIMWHDDNPEVECRACIDSLTGKHPLLRQITEQDIFGDNP